MPDTAMVWPICRCYKINFPHLIEVSKSFAKPRLENITQSVFARRAPLYREDKAIMSNNASNEH